MKKFRITSCPICQGRFTEALTLDRTPKDGTVVICQDGAWWHIVGTDDIERVLFIVPLSQKGNRP